jgi:aminopeptidase N
VYVRPGDLDKTEHAMNSLMASVAWDEARFGLPLDLERFMIVATSDFNMGAMENKGLNIFNTKFVLANPATATDNDFAGIESVVGHEYFHNWTGNRITCQDWFQLSLKEGLTVFRDQEFSQDMAGVQSARAVKRIEDVRVLRTVQFPEDAGPMAHPVRPDSYVEINNFYTVTIYEKGAEVVRMMQTLVSAPGDEEGKQGFAKGMKLYFERHDGQAVTCDDFAQAISDANPGSPLAQRLPQFKRWYSQAGTPRVLAEGVYNSDNRSFTLTLSQSCAATPDQAQQEPFVIPVSVGLLDARGTPMAVQLQGDTQGQAHPEFSKTLVLSESAQSFVFENIESVPTPSLLRNFTAPVNLDCTLTEEQWLTLLAHDTDSFNRWEAGQRLAVQAALRFIRGHQNPQTEPVLGTDYLQAMQAVLNHPDLDSAFKELVLTLPSETYISEQLESVDPQQVHAVREAMKLQLAQSLQSDWQTCYEQNKVTGAYSPDAKSSGKRALSGMALSMLCLAAVHDGTSIWPGKALQAFKDAHNMTDRFNALVALVGSGHDLAAQALAQFHALFKNEALVIDKWFGLQASTPDRGGNILPIVRQLMQHPDFNLRNPNRARSLIFSYCSSNPGGFHRTDAAGYVYWSESVIELDAINPQVAARLARALDRWKKLAEPYRQAAKAAIERVAAKSDLSNDVREVVTRALAE